MFNISIPQNKIEFTNQISLIDEVVFQQEKWSLSVIENTLKSSRSLCIVAENSSRIIGYVICSILDSECEIEKIAVLPEFRGMGVADLMLNKLFFQLKSENFTKVYLEVRKGNHAAYNLYTKNGFAVDGFRKKYYNNPIEDAILMSLEI